MLKHVAIIPDGSRRYAKKHRLPIFAGHERSISPERLDALFQEAIKLRIKYLSVWGFSTENWKRSKTEKAYLFELITSKLEQLIKDAYKNQIRFRHIGRRDRLPKPLLENLAYLEDLTKKFNKLNVQLCFDYGGRDEILRAVHSYCKKWGMSNNLTEEKFSPFLDTFDVPDVDLIIRTGGELRLSGFMPWQSTYAELYFTKTFFPDFSPNHFRKAVLEFKNRKRNFGQ